jgi:hypothetical protein
MVAGHGDAPAHEQFVAGAADPHQIDAGGPFGFGQRQQFL